MNLRLWALGLTGLLAACSVPEQTTIAGDQVGDVIETVESIGLGEGLYMVSTGNEMAGNLAFLTGPDGAVVVDDQLPDTGSLIEMALLNLSGEDVPRFVINTHGHPDHAGGNSHFAERGSAIIAHHNARARLNDPETQWVWTQNPTVLPIMTFEDGLTLHLNGQTIEISHSANAHTDGDVIVYFREADVLHMGDILLVGWFPYIDRAAGGSVEGTIAGLERGLAIAGENTRIIPGHGPLSGRAELEASLDMFREAVLRVRTRIEAGDSLETILASDPLADFEEDWAWRYVTTNQMVETIFHDLVDQ